MRQVVAPKRGRRRDWATNFLTLTVIAVALLLGWMLGRAGWQHVIGEKTASASAHQPGASPSRAADPRATETSDAVFAAPAKATQSPNSTRSPFQPKNSAGPRPDGGLVVYEHGKIIFQQTAPTSGAGHFSQSTAGAELSSAEKTGIAPPGDAVSLSPEAASAYLIRRVEPVYPEEARRQNIEGEVHLEALVGTDGSVEVLRLISGDSKLAQAAADAVRQWQFRPYISRGKTEQFNTQLTVSFRLQ
jgi:TonB family protein